MSIEARKQSRDIDGVTYEVSPLPWSTGHKAFAKVTKVFSATAAAAMAETSENKAGGAVIAAIMGGVSDDDLDSLTKAFATATRYSGAKGLVPLSSSIEIHFAGNYSAWFQWLSFCVEVNFGGFFGDLLQGKLVNVALAQETASA